MIKNIIFDIDGVLVDRDHSCWLYLKSFPQFAHITYDDLPSLYPIEEDDGAFDIPYEEEKALGRTIPETEYVYQRPIFDGVIETLKELKDEGIRLFTMTASSLGQTKKEWFLNLIGNDLLTYGCCPSGSKEAALKDMMRQYDMKPEETVFIDDRFYNLRTGIAVGLHVVRMQPKHHLPLPADLACVVPVVHNMHEFKKLIDRMNGK